MVINHRKKNSRQRGSWTHGWGEKKKHRGAGHRGGRGAAGSGKRGDAKKPSFWKLKKYVGKHGFNNPTRKKINTISISQLNSSIEKLVTSGNAVKDADVYKVNLSDLGIDKLLGTGSPVHAYELVVAQATKGAIEKIQKAKGSVLIASADAAQETTSEEPQEPSE